MGLELRHVGEAIALAIAETKYQALDVAELVAVDVETLLGRNEVDQVGAPDATRWPTRRRKPLPDWDCR